SIALNTIRLMIAGKQAHLTAIIKGINKNFIRIEEENKLIIKAIKIQPIKNRFSHANFVKS
ncbi:hypothetical protein, partial [Dubosiella newyorkensis]